jgi:hypothetical protein
VAGTWSYSGDGIAIDWFAEAGTPDGERLADEVGRITEILGSATSAVGGPSDAALASRDIRRH